MKKLLFLIGAALILVSCSKTDNLIGKWTLENIDYERYYQTLPEELRTAFRQKLDEQFGRMKGKTFFIFKENKSLELIVPDQNGKDISEKGSYQLNQERDHITFDLSVDETYRVDTLSSDLLVITTEEMPMRTLTLKKTE